MSIAIFNAIIDKFNYCKLIETKNKINIPNGLIKTTFFLFVALMHSPQTCSKVFISLFLKKYSKKVKTHFKYDLKNEQTFTHLKNLILLKST